MRNAILSALALCAPSAPALCAPSDPARADFESGAMSTPAVVHASLAEAWAIFTTPAGYRVLGVPKSDFDLRVGGSIRSRYDASQELGEPGTAVDRILSYEPLRMLSTRSLVPDDQPDKKPLERCWSVIRFEPLAPERTRVVISIYGWGDDQASRAAYGYFERANRHLLDLVARHFETQRAAEGESDPMELVRSLVGGDWIADAPECRYRLRAELAPDGLAVISRSWRESDGARVPYGLSLFTTDAVHGARHVSVNDQQMLATGALRRRGEHGVTFEWNVVRPDAALVSLRLEIDADGADRRRARFFRPGVEEPFLDLLYTRAAAAPAADSRSVEEPR